MQPLRVVTKEDLYNKYCEEGLTLDQIASDYGVTRGAIWQKMRRLGIPRRLSQFSLRHTVSEAVRAKLSASLKGRKPTRGFAGKHHITETKKKFSEMRKGVPKKKYTMTKPRPKRGPPSLETRRKQSTIMKAKGHHPPWWLSPKFTQHTDLTKEKMRSVWEERRSDKTKMDAWVRALHLKPNKSEIFLDAILQQNFTGCWRYTGDGRDGTQIGGKIPDWININGKKAVIELFGDFWHQEKTRTVTATMRHYAEYGFACLIIDYCELSKPQKVLTKVRHFLYEC